MRPQLGFSLIELLCAVALIAALAVISIPATSSATDDVRTAMAARYLEARIADARLRAVRRSARVALRFEPSGGDYAIAEYFDGNGNGVRSADITAGIDPPLGAPRTIGEMFPGVRFGLLPGIPPPEDDRSGDDRDGVRLGTGRLLSLSTDGTSSSGSLYLHGRHRQYAVRVLGATGRTRVLKFDRATDQWIAR